MASSGVNVLRWSALVFGVFYGFSHQRTITASQKSQHAKHEYQQKQKVIDQAKAEFAKQRNPAPAPADDVITDPENPNFDLEKMLEKVSKEHP